VSEEEKKKSLFDRAIDALTDRDEKEAEAKAVAEKVASEKAAAEKAAVEKTASEKAAAEKAAAEKATAVKAAGDRAAAERMAAAMDAADKAAAARIAAEKAAAAAPKKGIVTVRSLRIRADHNTTSEVVAGLVDGDEVTILSTWSDGKDTWAKLDKGWAAMVYEGETYIKLA
jgi:ATPase subunit of ABC transporter with duplicated ATPase domains